MPTAKIWMMLIVIGIVFTHISSADVLYTSERMFTFKQNAVSYIELPTNENDLSQCTLCTCSITITNPDGSSLVRNVDATMSSNYLTYKLYPNQTGIIGVYGADVYCTNGVDYGTATFSYEITPSGFEETTWFYMILIALISLVLILGFWSQESWFIVIGGMGLIMMGLYSINYGIAGFRDMFMTWGIALFEIGLGFILSIMAAWEKVNEL